ncbi:hypothetical protein CLOSTMETH_02574 [[Clostridium] methylpentosum DSM 5476]|uniref:Uncharacterized protein n=1 Tax=[Clostridium] methylpentosum DSM 5476 TaxID=537013 RepID=C0EFD2_9FIRM|nr:hypothetical protein CLOSTMETH_02574 [[Clostridium] methylpentosum DSM 5476]
MYFGSFECEAGKGGQLIRPNSVGRIEGLQPTVFLMTDKLLFYQF